MASLLKLYSFLLEQINNPEAKKKAELQRHLDECWKYSQEIEADPTDNHAYNMRAIARSELGLIEEAIKDCEASIKLDPTSSYLYEFYGMLKDLAGKYEEKIPCLDEAIKIDPTRDDLFYGRGKAKYLRNRFKEAIEDFDEAIKLNPQQYSLFYWRANAKIKLNMLKEGIADLDKTIEMLNERLNNEGIIEEIYDPLKLAYISRYEAKEDLDDYEGAKEDREKLEILEMQMENLKKIRQNNEMEEK